MYRVALESANLLRMSLVAAVAMLAICLPALVETTNTAGATSLPENGKIAYYDGANSIYVVNLFQRDQDDKGRYGIYAIDADGRNLRRLTKVPVMDSFPGWQPLPKPAPPKSHSETVHPPDTGGPSLLLDVDLPASGYYPNLLIRPSGYGLRYGTLDLTGPGLCTVFSLPRTVVGK